MRAILTYHSIDDSGSPISVPERVFRRHIEFLASRGPKVVTVRELLATSGGEPAVAITFDDAFANFGDVAWPLLREHGLPVSVFVPTDHAGRTNEWGGVSEPPIPVLPVLDWSRLARLSEEGVMLESHTCTHPRLTRVTATRLTEEMERSAEELEMHTGRRPTGLAYPYGVHDPAVVSAAAGVYSWACTTELRPLDDGSSAFLLPRLDAYYFQSEGTLESWGSTWLRMYVKARASARRCRELLMPVVR